MSADALMHVRYELRRARAAGAAEGPPVSDHNKPTIDLTPEQWRDRAFVMDALRTRLGDLMSAALVAWATTNAPDLIRRETVVKVTVPQAAAKQHLEATGEIPEGCELVPASQKLVYTAEVAS